MARIHDDEAEQIREVLRPFLNRRVEVEGTVTEVGTVNDHHTRRDVPSVCLNNVEVRTDDARDNPVIQHVWCSWALTAINAGVGPGDTVRFTAQVYQYIHVDRKSGRQVTRFAIREPREVRCLNRKLEPVDDGFDEAPAERRERTLRGGVGAGPSTLPFPVTTVAPAPFRPTPAPPVKPIDVKAPAAGSNGVHVPPAAPVVTPPAAVEPEPTPQPLTVTPAFREAAEIEATTPIAINNPPAPAAKPEDGRRALFNDVLSLVQKYGSDKVRKALKAVEQLTETEDQ